MERAVAAGVPRSSVPLWNTMLRGFSRGQHQEMRDVFAEMRAAGAEPDQYSWTTLISSYRQLAEMRAVMDGVGREG